MNITLQDPFCLIIDVIERDERLPSMRCAITVEADQFEQRLLYTDNIWVSCEGWNSFVRNLAANADNGAELVDMSNRISLRVEQSGSEYLLLFQGTRTSALGTICKAAVQAPMHRDGFAVLSRQFVEFNQSE
ncbi:hypothetical protein EN871_04760 [bacterium M00.F.Ca.ET.228.01.1.1]|uniref:hypothetical protein n=1 Tax=Paraburkholderia phenoliruptrix TaxID=252970 RepID=UPI0010921439|nr:hypothetical protein [Paraburkholderia phenoliruptrix]TGP45785.1 hypothetical protein EN871_04760 [bacterium M00.F.Ca.ET.228.01.1.1]TGS04302.1 hypothetical protein EN834_08225 [bacterium M00.F.Ca.ET.191.01.1.1]TGU07078.1 hypothetical protein EN798_08835 [bacterium M00.F.Ca.ET.155.01.1.1]MBW0448471.1 hypothetical protein [Paraburkholderia phenoliruptrix]MBW9100667.1 hypothetical protein [Paraburkholderia phenoliruptrix]